MPSDGLKRSSRTAIIAMIVTILVAGINIYMTYFYTSIHLSARVFRPQRERDTVFVTIAFFNTGNRMALLCDTKLIGQLDASSQSREVVFQWLPTEPIVINPGEIKTKRAFLPIIQYSQSANIPPSPTTPPPDFPSEGKQEWETLKKKYDSLMNTWDKAYTHIILEVSVIAFDGSLYKARHTTATRFNLGYSLEYSEMFEIISNETRVEPEKEKDGTFTLTMQ